MNNLKNKLLAEMGRDKKKTAVLSLLLLVGVVVVVRLVMSGPAPAKAQAAGKALAKQAPAAKQAADAAEAPAPDLLSGESGTNTQRDRYLQQLDTRITRDLFSASDQIFGPAPAGDIRARREASGGNTDLASRRAEVEQQSSVLKLQSTVVSETPTAIINDQVVKVGEVIEGFKIVAISPRGCIVEKNSIQLTLEMR
jgi:hypothetical protein